MNKSSNSKCKSSVLFSVRDKLKTDSKYYGKIYGDKPYRRASIFFYLLLFFLVLLLLIFSFSPNLSNDNLRYFLSASAQTIGAILGITLTMTLIFIQINIGKYGDKIYNYLFRSKAIISYISLSLITTIFSLFTILFVGKRVLFSINTDKLMFNFTLNNLININITLILLSFLFLPIFIYSLYSLLRGSSYSSWLYKNIIKNIKNKNTEEVEIYLSALISFVNNGVSERNRIIIKDGIESLHDLMKYGIRNEKEINDLMLIRMKKEGAFSNRSDWFYNEILSSSNAIFQIMKNSGQYNSIRFLVKSVQSYSIESLKYENTNILTDIIKEYKNLISLSIKNEYLPKILIDEFRYFFEHSLCMEERNFSILLNELFDEEFVINITKYNPHIVEKIFSIYFHETKKRDLGNSIMPLNVKNIPIMIQLANYIMNIFKELEKLKEFSDKELIINKRIKEALCNMSYLLSLYLFSKNKKEEAKKCKRYLNKFIREKEFLNKIKKDVSDTNDWQLRFNYLVHYLFTEATENGNLKFISKNEIIKLAENFKKIKLEETNKK